VWCGVAPVRSASMTTPTPPLPGTVPYYYSLGSVAAIVDEFETRGRGNWTSHYGEAAKKAIDVLNAEALAAAVADLRAAPEAMDASAQRLQTDALNVGKHALIVAYLALGVSLALGVAQFIAAIWGEG